MDATTLAIARQQFGSKRAVRIARQRVRPADAFTLGVSPDVTLGPPGTNTATRISSGVQVAWTANKLLLKNAGGFVAGASFPDTLLALPTSRYPNTYTGSGGGTAFSVDFFHDGQQFELWAKWFTGAAYRLRVDGRWITDTPQSFPATTSDSQALATGTVYKLLCDFGSRAVRRIQIDLYDLPFGGIYVGPNDTVWAPAPAAYKMLGFGDSLTAGSAGNTGFALGTWLMRCAQLLGYDEAWNAAIGGTGFVNPGTAAVYLDRIATDITPYGPFDLIVVDDAYNDIAAYVAGTFQAAVAAFFTALKAAAPTSLIVVVGQHSPSGTIGPTTQLVGTDLKNAALAAGLPFVDPLTGAGYDAAGTTIMPATTPWITGTGKLGATTGTGNADLYIYSDGIHLTDAGHRYKARRVADFIRNLCDRIA